MVVFDFCQPDLSVSTGAAGSLVAADASITVGGLQSGGVGVLPALAALFEEEG
jgi:hypothetical protein